MTDKYMAEANLTVDKGKECEKDVVLVFTNLTIGEAKAFMRIFDKFDHGSSNTELNLHLWEKQ